MPPIRQELPDFKPSTRGLDFANYYDPRDKIYLFNFNILGRNIPFGEAARGVCGGMVYTVRDYYEVGVIPPRDSATPPTSGPLFDHIARRLFASFNLLNLPPGPLRYLQLMNPSLPDGETWASKNGLAPRGRSWVMINEEWPAIKLELDNGHPAPLGLILIKSDDPLKMGENHQVLAYGYELDGEDLSLFIYDPNYPNRDNLALSLSLSNPELPTPVTYNGRSGSPVWCFFCSDYTFSFPPLQGGITLDIILRAGNGKYITTSWFTKNVLAKADQPGSASKFQLIDQNNSPLRSGDPVALRTVNGRFMTVRQSGSPELIVREKDINPWDSFTILLANGTDGEISYGQQVAFRAQNGKFISAGSGSNATLVADQSVVGFSETFTLEKAL